MTTRRAPFVNCSVRQHHLRHLQTILRRCPRFEWPNSYVRDEIRYDAIPKRGANQLFKCSARASLSSRRAPVESEPSSVPPPDGGSPNPSEVQMKAAVLVVLLTATSARTASAQEPCWVQYGLCMTYCDKLLSACALRCDDRKMQCEQPRNKKPQRKSSRIIPA
jgi:hypothetical protein